LNRTEARLVLLLDFYLKPGASSGPVPILRGICSPEQAKLGSVLQKGRLRHLSVLPSWLRTVKSKALEVLFGSASSPRKVPLAVCFSIFMEAAGSLVDLKWVIRKMKH